MQAPPSLLRVHPLGVVTCIRCCYMHSSAAAPVWGAAHATHQPALCFYQAVARVPKELHLLAIPRSA
jgi:hypothetical protein